MIPKASDTAAYHEDSILGMCHVGDGPSLVRVNRTGGTEVTGRDTQELILPHRSSC
jgi:hypothetical protein